MLKNYIKTALRNVRKEKSYALINIVGLAIGMACCLVILQYIRFELSYDKFHEKADRIYRVIENKLAYTPDLLAPALKEYFPEIATITRIEPDLNNDRLVKFNDKEIYITDFWRADPNVFDVFSFDFIKGNPEKALVEPNSVILTEEMAQKIFGQENPLGKIINYENKQDYKVTGVIKNIPANSHFHFNFLASWKGYNHPEWFMRSSHTFIVLPKHCHAREIEKRIPDFVATHVGEDEVDKKTFKLQPLIRIHLYSHLIGELAPNNDIRYIYIFTAIAILILFIACINYMNLATVRASRRVKEIGIRKVLGAQRKQLIQQFATEAFLYSLIALILAFVFVELAQPVFKNLLNRELNNHYLSDWIVIVAAFGITIVAGLVSGSYPALCISSILPGKIFKGISNSGTFKMGFRKVLITGQFVISTTLIIITIIMHSQLRYIQNERLGFDKDQVIEIKTRWKVLGNNYAAFKNKLLQYPSIRNVSAGDVPGKSGGYHITMKSLKKNHMIRVIEADYDYIKTLGLKIVQGRDFSKHLSSDLSEAILVNETMVKEIEWKQPLVDSSKDLNGKVIGILEDFHMQSLHEIIMPTIIKLRPGEFPTILVKIDPKNIAMTIKHIEKTWQEFAPNWPLHFSFLETSLTTQYQFEQKLKKLFDTFAFLALFISCLGLFGLGALSAEQRTKEIGIRKVLGASTSSIVVKLSKEYTHWVLLANILAWPIAWYIMNKWLQNFAYRIDISWWMFLLAGVIALVIALVTVSFQVIKASTANPVEALRYE